MRREKRSGPGAELERLHQLPDLHDHLVAIGHPEACSGIFTCDPWKYEPILLDELISERAGANDPTRLAEIRGLIRAGSWMSSPRTETKDAQADLRDVALREDQDWNARIRHADPDTAMELKQNHAQLKEELRRVEAALSAGSLGEVLEGSVRTIENLNASLWLQLRKLMAANGLDIQTAKSHPTARLCLEELEYIRPLRNFLYYRRLYPKWASLGSSRSARP